MTTDQALFWGYLCVPAAGIIVGIQVGWFIRDLWFERKLRRLEKTLNRLELPDA